MKRPKAIAGQDESAVNVEGQASTTEQLSALIGALEHGLGHDREAERASLERSNIEFAARGPACIPQSQAMLDAELQTHRLQRPRPTWPNLYFIDQAARWVATKRGTPASAAKIELALLTAARSGQLVVVDPDEPLLTIAPARVTIDHAVQHAELEQWISRMQVKPADPSKIRHAQDYTGQVADVNAWLAGLQVTVALREEASDAASDGDAPAAPDVVGARGVCVVHEPLGLTTDEVCVAFAGLGWPQEGWEQTFRRGAPTWLKECQQSPGVRGATPKQARWNPIKIARHLFSGRSPKDGRGPTEEHQVAELKRLSSAFNMKPSLKPWRSHWQSEAEELNIGGE